MRRIRIRDTGYPEVLGVWSFDPTSDLSFYGSTYWTPRARRFTWTADNGTPYSVGMYSTDLNTETVVLLANGAVGLVCRGQRGPALETLGLREVTP